MTKKISIVIVVIVIVIIFVVALLSIVKKKSVDTSFSIPDSGALQKSPDVNPVDKTNPFKNVKTNPFE